MNRSVQHTIHQTQNCIAVNSINVALSNTRTEFAIKNLGVKYTILPGQARAGRAASGPGPAGRVTTNSSQEIVYWIICRAARERAG